MTKKVVADEDALRKMVREEVMAAVEPAVAEALRTVSTKFRLYRDLSDRYHADLIEALRTITALELELIRADGSQAASEAAMRVWRDLSNRYKVRLENAQAKEGAEK